MKQTDLSIIIVSWNVKTLLEKCLQSVFKNTALTSEVIVVDNASRDGSPQFIMENFPEVMLIQNQENLGFACANNVAIKKASGKYVVFLNPDTLLLEDTFFKMVQAMEAQKNVGAIGCKLIDEGNNIDFHCATDFPTIDNLIFRPYLEKIFGNSRKTYTIKDWDHQSERYVDVLSGTCLMVRKEILEKVSGFDEQIFLYVEDVELCYRIKQAGWDLYYLADSAIIHYGKQSVKQDYHRMNAESVRSMRKFFIKHKSVSYGVSFEILTIINFVFKFSLFSAINLFKPNRRQPKAIQDYLTIALELIKRP